VEKGTKVIIIHVPFLLTLRGSSIFSIDSHKVNKLISDEVASEQFVCDLNSCKGGCCEDGDTGAPLENEELQILRDLYSSVKPYLTPEGISVLEQQGLYAYDQEFGWVTPTVGGCICAYGFRDRHGVIKCGIEQAYMDNKISWKNPLAVIFSCKNNPQQT